MARHALPLCAFMRLLCAFVLLVVSATAEEVAIAPYPDPAQLDCPWPKSSHFKQPWRGFLETRSGSAFLDGLGVNLHIPDGREDLAMRLLAETGFKTARIEVGWGESNWDQTGFNNDARIRRRFQLCAKYGLRPTILINAHQGAPCPVKLFNRKLTEDAPKGATKLKLERVDDLSVDRSGLSQLTDYWAAEALVTDIDTSTREVTLSKPLPKDLKAGDVPMATLKYPPLAPVGTPEFDETAGGWVDHTLRVCRLARECGVREFDLELWNELTFGTRFLDANNYYDKAKPKFPQPQPDFLNPGGRCWELAKRTVDAVKAEFPAVRVIWGFSNTTFYHTAIPKLPPGIDGQSYHPYGTGTRVFDGQPPRKDQPPLEGFVPRYAMRLPEGLMATFVQTECLFRLLNPLDRLSRRPPGTKRFYHFMTEHGVLAKECGIENDAGAWELKALCASRSFCFWLNKGVDALHYFDAYEKDPQSFGLLPANLPTLPDDAKFEQVATPPMRTIRNLSRAFAGSFSVSEPSPLQVEVTAIDGDRVIFDGDADHLALRHRDVFAVLPFQLTPTRYLIACYVMTRDANKPIAPERYRLMIHGAKGKKVRFYDPHEDKTIPVELRPTDDAIEVTLQAIEHPRLLTIEP